jgi:hypothetical protein
MARYGINFGDPDFSAIAHGFKLNKKVHERRVALVGVTTTEEEHQDQILEITRPGRLISTDERTHPQLGQLWAIYST